MAPGSRRRGRRGSGIVLVLLAVALGGLPATAVPEHTASGDIFTVAGTGTAGFTGDGAAATLARLQNPSGVAVDAGGNVFIADTSNHRIRRVDAVTGIITTVAGTGVAGFSGDGGQATSAQLNGPWGVTVADNGDLFIADTGNHRVRKVTAGGVMSTYAGTGTAGFNGDGLATVSRLNGPRGVFAVGDLVYVADTFNHRVRVVLPPLIGQIATIAGDGSASFGGDGGPAVDASLNEPAAVAVHPNGNLFIVDRVNHRVRRVDVDTQLITTVAGTGAAGFSGDGGPATSAQLNFPAGVAVDPTGQVFVSDSSNHRIRVVDADTGVIDTWAGSGIFGSSGDGGPASAATLGNPRHLAVDAVGNLYIANALAQTIRLVETWEFEVIRLAGANRFETAAAVAAEHYPNGAGLVLVATGSNFPDALAGAAFGGKGIDPHGTAPLLLTSSAPPATSAALVALDPDVFVVLGGEAAVSDDTAIALSTLTQASWTRIAGANRYETAVEISKASFPPGGADVVVIATGENFPDALAGAPAAVRLGGPVLLTPRDSVPPAVILEIGRLDPDEIVVLGGEAAVSQQAFDVLQGLKPTTRISGANRYATAVAISQHAFPDPVAVNRVYVAVGTNFPDALAGAAVAAAKGSPVLLSPTDTLPQAVIDEILRLAPTRIYVLGGTAVISPAVKNALAALLGP